MNCKILTIAALGVLLPSVVSARNEIARQVAGSVTTQVGVEVKTASEPKEDVIAPAPKGKGHAIDTWEWTDAGPDPLFSVPVGSTGISPELKFWKIPARKAPGKAKFGTIIPKDYDVRGTVNYMAMELIHGDKADTIVNVGTSGSRIVIKIDEAAGTVSIPPQVVLRHNTYGNVYIYPCSVSGNKLVYDDKSDVKGTLSVDGKINLEGWGLFVGQGDSKGSWFMATTRSEWIPANTRVTLSKPDGTADNFNALVEQPFDNELAIYNLAGYANPIMASMGSDRNIRITPQLVYTNAMFGPFFNYAAQEVEAGKYSILTNTYTTASGTAHEITTSPWVIAARMAPTTYVTRIVSKAVINTDLELRYPVPVSGSFEGSGTEADPYRIKSETDLRRLAQQVQTNDFKGKFFRLENNITITNKGSQFMPVGDLGSPFEGTIDGNGKTISGLRFDARGANYAGLIGNLGANGKVTNLNIDDFILQSSGAWISPLVADNLGTISNCKVTRSRIASNGQSAGGITARSAGLVEDCSFSGEITGVGNIGGIVGYNYSKILRCHSDAALKRAGHVTDVYRDIAGIAGTSASSEGYSAHIADCYFEGSINESSGYGIAGGIVGKIVNASMIRSFNVGSISHMREDDDYDNYTGGVAAYVRTANISDCFNAGTIVKSSSKGLTSEGAGGIIGYVSVRYASSNGGPMTMADKSKILNCFNTAQVISSSPASHKGVWGMTFTYQGMDPIPETFENCWFDSQTSGFADEDFGKSTAEMTKASLPSGYSSDLWTAEAGRYPVLKLFRNIKASDLAAAVPMLAGNEDVRKVKKNFTLSSADGIVWKFFDSNSSNLIDETPSLKISGRNVSIKDKYGNDVLVAMTSDGASMKLYRLAPVPHLFEGEGTEASPYLVKSAADFKTIDLAVGTYAQAHIGDYFKMTGDIDFASTPEFQGVGAKKGTSVSFGASFDGGGHTIHNLKIAATQVDDSGEGISGTFYAYAGLFDVINRFASIRNLNIASDCSILGYTTTGSIAGYTEGLIENCRNYAQVKGARQTVGGIVGTIGSTGKVTGCYNAGFVAAGYSGAGGIAGINRGLVELCQNDGEISGERVNGDRLSQGVVGGIAGQNLGTVDRCVNNANIGAASQVGGIAGINSTSGGAGNITRSVSNGIVDARTEVASRGGMVGTMGTYGTIENNYYDASVNVNGAANNTSAKGMNALNTTDLVSGQALQGLDAREWSFKAGAYPVLAAFAAEPLSQALRSVYVGFVKGQSRANVTKDLDLAATTGISWSLKQNKDFTIADGKLKITVPTGMTMAADTLTASLGGISKVYFLKSIPTIFKGEGTIESPYLIESVDDMEKLAEFMDITKMEYSGYNFRLVNDLDYTGRSLRVVAPINVKFMATFDGNNKKIYNYNFSNTSSKSGEGRYVGLFGIVGETGHIKNLTMDGTFEGNSFIGTFAGDLYGQISNCVNKGTIKGTSTSSAGIAGIVSRAFGGSVVRDCRNEGTVDSKGTVNGGIVATLKQDALIENCVNDGVVKTTSTGAGGIAGETYGAIRGCVNKKTVVAGASIAGIAANAFAAATEISGCVNEADLKVTNISSGSTVAGIVCRTEAGKVNNLLVKDCINRGNITAKGYSAGIISYIYQGARAENCVNYGTIQNTGASNAGGIVATIQGSSAGQAYMINCRNEGHVDAHWSYSGGVAGLISSDAYVENCYNLGEVTMTGYNGSTHTGNSQTIGIGGFTGAIRGYAVGCWNAGNVTTNYARAGGFTGILQASPGHVVIEKCFNLGKVTAKNVNNYGNSYGCAGGLVGYTVGLPEANDCYNMGEVTAPQYAGGLIGRVNKTKTTLRRCYNAGKVNSTDGSENWGNIAYNPNGESCLELVNTYYDTNVNPKSTRFDRAGTGLSTADLYKGADLGEAYHLSRGAYPVIATTAEPSLAHYAAAGYEFWTSTDKESNLTDNLYVGNHGTERWTPSEHFVIKDGVAFPVKLGEGTLTLTSPDGNDSRVFRFNITKVSGVESAVSEAAVVSRQYIDMQGRTVADPRAGEVYVVRTQYDDGTFTVEKRIFND